MNGWQFYLPVMTGMEGEGAIPNSRQTEIYRFGSLKKPTEQALIKFLNTKTHTEQIMKKIQIPKFCGLALAALLLGASNLAFAQGGYITNFVNNFDEIIPAGTNYGGNYYGATNVYTTTPVGCGKWYGSSSILWDNSQDNTGDGGGAEGQAGSAYIYSTLSSGSDTPLADWVCYMWGTNDNLWYNGNPPGVPLSQYLYVQFDIKWDTANSTIGIDDFNNLGTTYQPALAGSIPGLEIDAAGFANTSIPKIGTVMIPDAASNGWVTVQVPIGPNAGALDGAAGIYLHKWINNVASYSGSDIAAFWIDNVIFVKTNAPIPPPTIIAPTKPTPGLNVIASTSGNTYYDRQSVMSLTTNGLSWVGNATPANPVTYSFTINGFPQDPSTLTTPSQNGCEAYLFLVPNPTYQDNAPDWNQANCIIAFVQQDTNTATFNFTYKTNEPNAGTTIAVTNVTYTGTALGTWSITFTNNTDFVLTAPDGTKANGTIPSGAAALFGESANPGFYVYLGMQANNAASLNQAVCYSQFSVSGVPSPISDNFLADSTLNTNAWNNAVSTGPAGVFVTPTNAAYWISWTSPALGYQLQQASDIQGPWTIQTNNPPVITEVGKYSQLLINTNLPSGGNAFFELINTNSP